jgi:hypothetical protein
LEWRGCWRAGWLARAAKSKAFIRAEQRRLQGDLFAGTEPAPGRPRSERHVEPDPDHVARQEQADGQKWKRRAAALRGKPVKPPHP